MLCNFIMFGFLWLISCSVDAANKINRYAADLVIERSVSAEDRSKKLIRIAILTLNLVVLQFTDLVGPFVGAATFLNIPMVWMILSLLAAGAGVAVLHMIKTRINKTKGEFVLKYDVNAPIRLSALQQWLRRQLLVRVRIVKSILSTTFLNDRSLSHHNQLIFCELH